MKKPKNVALIFEKFELGNSLLEWDRTEYDMRTWLVECMEEGKYIPTEENLFQLSVIMDYYTELMLNLCTDSNSNMYLDKYLVDFKKLFAQGIENPNFDSTVPVEISWCVNVHLLILKSNQNKHTVDSILNDIVFDYKEFISLLASDKWLRNKIYDNTFTITHFTYDNE